MYIYTHIIMLYDNTLRDRARAGEGGGERERGGEREKKRERKRERERGRRKEAHTIFESACLYRQGRDYGVTGI